MSAAVGRMVLSSAPMPGKRSAGKWTCHGPADARSAIHRHRGGEHGLPAARARRLGHVIEEYSRTLRPGHVEGKLAAFITRAIQCSQACAAQIFIEHADMRFAD